jgi:cold shock CspA family protein
VRCAWNHFQRRPLNNFGREKTRYRDRCDLIVIAVQNKSWYIEPLEVFREISLRKSLNALVDGFVPLEANSSGRRLHYTYARLLMAITPEDGENIAYHLQRAFTDGDSNYEAQLLYGRQRFLNGRFEESRTAFRRLSGVRVAPEIKNRLLHPILDRRSEGRMSRPQGSYAFITRDGPGDSIYVHATNVPEDIWKVLTMEMRVRFSIAFSLRGASAFELKII